MHSRSDPACRRMGAVVCAQSTQGDGATGKAQGLGDVPCFGIWGAVVTRWQHTLPTWLRTNSRPHAPNKPCAVPLPAPVMPSGKRLALPNGTTAALGQISGMHGADTAFTNGQQGWQEMEQEPLATQSPQCCGVSMVTAPLSAELHLARVAAQPSEPGCTYLLLGSALSQAATGGCGAGDRHTNKLRMRAQ